MAVTDALSHALDDRPLGVQAARRAQDDNDRAEIVKLASWLLCGLALVAFVAYPVAKLADEPAFTGLIAFSLVGLLSGAALLRWGDRVSLQAALAAPFWSAILIAPFVLFAQGEARFVFVLPVMVLAYVGRVALTALLIGAIALIYAAALAINDRLDVGRPVSSWVVLVMVLAGAAYIVLRIRRTSEAQTGALVSLAQALDLRDTGTATHSTTVAELAERLAAVAGLPPERSREVGLAGLLHDVGKIGVPDAVLQKPGPLTDEEWVLMRGHAEWGAQIVLSAGLPELAEWIGMHHERLDGTGYPRGMAGDEIPVEARILAITDAYEAITTARPYQDARSTREALAILREESAARRLDAVLVGLLHEVVAERSGEQAVFEQPRALV